MTDQASKPERVQLRRTKGWRMPPNSMKVDRSTLWGNPFRVGDDGVTTVEQAVRLFGKLLERPDAELDKTDDLFMFRRIHIQTAMRGYNLACWCKPGTPCHADLLLEIANGPLCPELAAMTENDDKQQEDVHADSNETSR